MSLILDASMVLSWMFERQKPEEKTCSAKALAVLAETEAKVPELWHIEIINALLVGERRAVITQAQTSDFLFKLSHLPIKTDDHSNSSREVILSLAREYQLSSYDTIYLDLALNTNAVLATFDKNLAKAMVEAGGKIFS